MESNNRSGNFSSEKSLSLDSTIYYGVYTPNEYRDYTSPNVFQDKTEALKLVKKNKKSRFKVFQFYHEAAEFAMNGSECPNNNTSMEGPFLQKKVLETSQNFSEKVSPFKGPKPQELVELRKAIEVGNYQAVKNTIWQNPRYLVSSGDTPSILQEGPRYNALHVAAKAKNARITELILSTISNVEFIKLLYGDDNDENAEERVKIMLDLYLNTPNKGLNETPLHFASKYGADDVVEILVSYPQCDKSLKNKFNKTAEQVICERVDHMDINIKKRIDMLLQDNFYVPVLRTEDNSLPPVIGTPFSPTSPPVLNSNPLSPRLEIHAYAGPMNREGAQQFRKIWKTPPRTLNFSPSSNSNLTDNFSNVVKLKFKDPEKGLERLGKTLANELKVCWKEYWPFLNSFIDITSEDGLNMLENYLAGRHAQSNELHLKHYLIDSNVKKFNGISPVTDLCATLQACKLNDSTDVNLDFNTKNVYAPLQHIQKACQVFSNRISNDIICNLSNNYVNLVSVLETEIKQLEDLICSYVEDGRFCEVNFHKIHSYLGAVVAGKLYRNIKEEIRLIQNLEEITKNLDCFSSDDEGVYHREAVVQEKPTSTKKQLICLVHYVLNFLTHYDTVSRLFSEENQIIDWDKTEECPCVFQVRKSRKSSSRSNSIKYMKNGSRLECSEVSKRLSFDDDEDDYSKMPISNGLHDSVVNSGDSISDCSSDEDFFTPPSSPILSNDNRSSDEEFDDAEIPAFNVFIEGDEPTKTDAAVFNALKYAGCVVKVSTHPNIYRWHHSVNLYTEVQRERWPSPHKNGNEKKVSQSTSESPHRTANYSPTSTPSKSWVRITGANSPRAVFKTKSPVVKI